MDTDLGGDPGQILGVFLQQPTGEHHAATAAGRQTAALRAAKVVWCGWHLDGLNIGGARRRDIPPGGTHNRAIVMEGQAFDGLFEFAHIARPVMELEFLQQFRLEAFEIFANTHGSLTQEEAGEVRNILGVVA